MKAVIFDCWDTIFYNEAEKTHHFQIFAERIGRSFQDYEFLKVFEKHFMLEKHYKLETPIKDLLIELNIKNSKELIIELRSILEEGLNSPKSSSKTLKVLNELKKKYKLGLITNTFYQSFERLEKKFKINEIFDVILKSYETKTLKPDPKVFELMIKKLKVDKDEVLMIGDSLKDDIEAAENIGIKGILIDRKGKHLDYPSRITSLDQLKEFL